MINFEWQKPILEKKLVDGSLENVIKTVHWRYKGTEDNISADVYGALSLQSPNAENFIEWENMTNDKVFEWLESILDVEQLQSQISAQIEDIKNPKVIVCSLD
jgi:hypothetical protein